MEFGKVKKKVGESRISWIVVGHPEYPLRLVSAKNSEKIANVVSRTDVEKLEENVTRDEKKEWECTSVGQG